MKKKIRNALVSVSDKDNLKNVLKTLRKYKINIISSGGTYKNIKKLGYSCTEISQYTGFQEMLNGRVKTLHPKIHAGILNDRNNKKHQREMNKERFSSIDLIIVNFYPFQRTVIDSKNPNKIGYFYVLTPKGALEKTKLTVNFMQRKMKEYEELKKELKNNK